MVNYVAHYRRALVVAACGLAPITARAEQGKDIGNTAVILFIFVAALVAVTIVGLCSYGLKGVLDQLSGKRGRFWAVFAGMLTGTFAGVAIARSIPLTLLFGFTAGYLGHLVSRRWHKDQDV